MSNKRHEVELKGCAPTPLAHYLKALGILRLVSEQVDQTAQGWWKNDEFVLRSRFDQEELVKFFLESYQPTPLVGPWGARSGFYAGSPETKSRIALERIIATEDERFNDFRCVAVATRTVMAKLNINVKPDDDDEKLQLMKACRGLLPDLVVPWFDATFVLLNSGRSLPPLLGTGGNEGSGSYFSGFAQQIVEALIDRRWDDALYSALFQTTAHGISSAQTPGHFSPESLGGANASTGFKADATTNPWDYILLLEGTLFFGSACAKRLEATGSGSLIFPFCTQPSGVGYASSSLSDEKKSKKAKRSPVEMWFPMWTRPAGVNELRQVFSEGRVQVRNRAARNGVDFARAIASFGIDKGISAFERYSFLERNSPLLFAVPLGRFEVHSSPGVDELLTEVDGWLDRFRRAATSKTAPARAGRALRRLESAILDLCQYGRTTDVQAVLVALGEAEATVAISTKLREDSFLSPVPLLSPQWISNAYDGTVEFRLAAALASIFHTKVGPFRRHLEPIDWKLPFSKWSEDAGDPNIVWGGGGLVRNLLVVLKRRTVEVLKCGKQESDGDLFFPCRGRYAASLGDIAAFINRDLNDDRIEALLRGLILIDWRSVPWDVLSQLRGRDTPMPDAAYALLKLCHLSMPFPLAHGKGERAIPLTPAITHRAAAGDGTTATRLAARRLRGSGFPTAVELVPFHGERARRTAAALLFPLWHSSTAKHNSPVERLRDSVIRWTKPPNDYDDKNEHAPTTPETEAMTS